MRPLILIFSFILYGCSYTQPVLVHEDMIDTDKLRNLADTVNLENMDIEVRSKSNSTIEINSIDKRVPWQMLTYNVKDIQQLLSTTLNKQNQEDSKCKTIVYIKRISHDAHPVGLNYTEVYINGDFIITNSCAQFKSCNIYAEYKTDYSFWTPSVKNKRYTEAIIGVILKASVAAQSCPSENEN